MSVSEQAPVGFELDRFDAGDDRLKVSGRWHGVRGRRFVRPSLSADVDGRAKRALAELEHKPWAPEEDDLWVAAFPWQGPVGDIDDFELAVAPDLAVRLPPPNELRSGADGDLVLPAVRPTDGDGGSAAARSGPLAEVLHRSRREQRRTNELVEVIGDRDEAMAERDRAVAAESAAEASRDAAIAERDRARAERDAAAAAANDAAVAERDQVVGERDAAVAERDQVVGERDAALAERDRAVAARNAAARKHNKALRERDEAVAVRQGSARELGRARIELSRALSELTTTRNELVQSQLHLTQAQRELAAARAVRAPAHPVTPLLRRSQPHWGARVATFATLAAIVLVLLIIVASR